MKNSIFIKILNKNWPKILILIKAILNSPHKNWDYRCGVQAPAPQPDGSSEGVPAASQLCFCAAVSGCCRCRRVLSLSIVRSLSRRHLRGRNISLRRLGETVAIWVFGCRLKTVFSSPSHTPSSSPPQPQTPSPPNSLPSSVSRE